ncbi:hypothetical protein [Vibrio mimicus]|uniref:hypothetical protein n=1 Tax=Vibrio TaxID=662 RepID=UPI002FF2089B|nr:hypothetical protein [Vibrio vulnificus]EIZ1363914.1 hypothetical protein [Vibrio vulnificus]
MQYGSVNIEGNQLYTSRNASPIDIKNIEYMYVKQHNSISKAQRAALIGAAVSALFFIFAPLLGLVVFPLIFLPIYFRAFDFDLRVFVTNNSGFGAKEVSLHRSNYRDEYDKVIAKVKALKQT